MMKIKILFNIMRKQILLFFVLSIFFSNAQTKWTLEECVIYALENNISIKQTENALQIKILFQPKVILCLYLELMHHKT